MELLPVLESERGPLTRGFLSLLQSLPPFARPEIAQRLPVGDRPSKHLLLLDFKLLFLPLQIGHGDAVYPRHEVPLARQAQVAVLGIARYDSLLGLAARRHQQRQLLLLRLQVKEYHLAAQALFCVLLERLQFFVIAFLHNDLLVLRFWLLYRHHALNDDSFALLRVVEGAPLSFELQILVCALPELLVAGWRSWLGLRIHQLGCRKRARTARHIRGRLIVYQVLLRSQFAVVQV